MARAALLVLMLACSDPAARVELVPVSPCGQVTNETALRVVAYTAGGEQRRTVPPTEIDAFPADTEQLGVEVIGDSGRLVAVGKTAPLAYGTLADGTNIPIVMAPLDGFCAVGPMTEPRRAPVMALAGDLVLLVGGIGPGGERLATAEVYDPATATFSPVSVPPQLMDPDNGLAGAVLTPLPDGRVALTGTSSHAFALFDPEARRFSAPSLFDHRAFHGAYAVAADRLLVIGGCADVVGGACSGPSLRTGFVYHVDDLAMRDRGPALDASAIRHGARVLSLGPQQDGATRYLLAGGTGEPGAADRFALADATAERLAIGGTDVALLDGGAVLAAGDGSAAVLAPEQSVMAAAALPPVAGPLRLLALEDGSVLAFGAGVARYRPGTNRWTTLDAPTLFDAPSLVRLPDGSVLVAGSDATAEAWIYRPSLIGPSTGSIIAVPGGAGEEILTPSDPSAVERSGDQLALLGTATDLAARVFVGGPRMAQGSISAVVRVTGGGVALLAQQTGPGAYLAGRLVPGEAARIEQRSGGAATTLCSGTAVTEAELTVPVTLTIAGGTATLAVGPTGAATVKATCEVPTAERGLWGLAAVGEGARVELGPVTVARTR